MAEPYVDFMPFRFETLGAPVVLTNGGGESSILVFSENLVTGTYLIGVDFVVAFDTQNQQLLWRIDGSFPSPTFFDESKDGEEHYPSEFTFPVEWAGGVMAIELFGEANGAGTEIIVDPANIHVQRVA